MMFNGVLSCDQGAVIIDNTVIVVVWIIDPVTRAGIITYDLARVIMSGTCPLNGCLARREGS